MRTRTVVHGTTAVLMALLMGVVAQGSIARRLSLEELSGYASNIVVGQCVARECAWNADHSQIVTVARYQVAEDLKGSLADTVDVESLGGEVDGVGMYVPGMPSFDIGRHDVLFLQKRPNAPFEVVGLGQGQFRISFPAKTSAPVVDQTIEGIQLIGPGDGRLARQSYSQFVRLLRQMVR